MARRAHAYPHALLTAAELVDGAVVTAPPTITAGDALRLARRRQAAAVACGGEGLALRDDLARAAALGLADLPARDLARPLPVVAASDSEVAVRRHLASGGVAVVVAEGGTAVGVVGRVPPPRTVAMQARIARVLPPGPRQRLAAAGRIAEAHGARAFAVGGLVRDAWLGRPPAGRDLDVVVEGDGLAVARALAAEVGGSLVEHERFLTASVTVAAGDGAPDAGRIDVVTARTERYDTPGALPRVLPGSIAQDLRRRDFTVNAMAVELASGAFELLDPLGGTTDLARQRLRVLHPLSFVEDPTRIFRGARYAARLGLAPDAWTARCQALALRLAPYPALSGQRIALELDRILGDAHPDRALLRLGRAGAFRLLDGRHRFTRATARRVAALPGVLEWARAHGLDAGPREVAALALVADQAPDVARAWLRRLAVSGEPLARIERALQAPDARRAAGSGAGAASAAAAALRGCSGTGLAWLWLEGDAAARERLQWFVTRARRVAPALRGDDLIALGVRQGPDVARLLGALRDARLDGEIRDREGEIAYVKTWIDPETREG